MKTDYYVAYNGESLKEIAVKTNVGYTRLLKYNPQYADGVPKGASVILSLEEPETQTGASEKKQEEEKTPQKETSQKENTVQSKQENSKKEDDSANEEKYKAELEEAKSSFTEKQKKLAESIKKSREKRESNFAAQKIDASSIAQNDREKTAREAFAQRETLNKEFNEKALKLTKALEAIKK